VLGTEFSSSAYVCLCVGVCVRVVCVVCVRACVCVYICWFYSTLHVLQITFQAFN
jgi:hypothetical protein